MIFIQICIENQKKYEKWDRECFKFVFSAKANNSRERVPYIGGNNERSSNLVFG